MRTKWKRKARPICRFVAVEGFRANAHRPDYPDDGVSHEFRPGFLRFLSGRPSVRNLLARRNQKPTAAAEIWSFECSSKQNSQEIACKLGLKHSDAESCRPLSCEDRPRRRRVTETSASSAIISTRKSQSPTMGQAKFMQIDANGDGDYTDTAKGISIPSSTTSKIVRA